ncbi:hypothetical protein HK098_004565 [Nowakowskiella sp. JEL0407]|nr:hypothetical protein HK098_004565 [Nowakowskiella sp. JEL0407]
MSDAQAVIELYTDFIQKVRSNAQFQANGISELDDLDIAKFMVNVKGKEDVALKRIEATLGPTKSGVPVLIWTASRHRPTDFPMEHTVRYMIRTFEENKKSGVIKDRIFGINDRTGMKRSNLDPVLMRTMVTTFSAHYPERLEFGFVFPTSYLLTVGWSVIKLFIDPEHAKRIQMYTEKEFKSEILKYVEAENLPKKLGGYLPDSAASVSKVSLIDPKDDVNAEEVDPKIIADMVKTLGDVDKTEE